MKRSSWIVVAALGCLTVGGCSTYYTERHPTTESRIMTPAEDAYWIERQSRQDKAREWSFEIERQSAARLAREFSN